MKFPSVDVGDCCDEEESQIQQGSRKDNEEIGIVDTDVDGPDVVVGGKRF